MEFILSDQIAAYSRQLSIFPQSLRGVPCIFNLEHSFRVAYFRRFLHKGPACEIVRVDILVINVWVGDVARGERVALYDHLLVSALAVKLDLHYALLLLSRNLCIGFIFL